MCREKIIILCISDVQVLSMDIVQFNFSEFGLNLGICGTFFFQRCSGRKFFSKKYIIFAHILHQLVSAPLPWVPMDQMLPPS